MKFVIDASVAVRWYIKETKHPHADKVLEVLVEKPELFAVPELFFYETLSVLYRLHPQAKLIFNQDINRILHSGILRYPMTENLYLKADKFIKTGLTGYDAIYVALAEELGGLWLTFDAKAHKKIAAKKLSLNLFESSI